MDGYQAWSVIAGETPTTAKWNIIGANDALFSATLAQLIADNTMRLATDGANVGFDMGLGRLWEVTITGNRTLQFNNVGSKRPFGIFIKQGSGGNKSVVWPAGIWWPYKTPPVLSVEEGQVDAFVFFPTATWAAGSNEIYYGAFGQFAFQAPDA